MTKMKRQESQSLSDERCVFCLRARGTTDEHIIPRAIGGSIVILRGTCGACLEKIQLYEGKLLSTHYASAQTLLGIKTKSGKPRSGFKGPKWTPDHKSAKNQYLRAEEHSGFITTVNYEPAGIEVGRPPQEGFGKAFSMYMTQLAPGADVPALSTVPVGDQYSFAPWIAKMAHAYWIMKEGHDSLHFMLQSLVLEQDFSLAGFLIGKCKEVTPTDDLHYINHKVVKVRNAYWGRVDICLFSAFNAPEFQARYSVYLGRLKTGPLILLNPNQSRRL